MKNNPDLCRSPFYDSSKTDTKTLWTIRELLKSVKDKPNAAIYTNDKDLAKKIGVKLPNKVIYINLK